MIDRLDTPDLTDTQHNWLEFILACYTSGFLPTFGELADNFDVCRARSTAVVKQLRIKGYLRIDRHRLALGHETLSLLECTRVYDRCSLAR